MTTCGYIGFPLIAPYHTEWLGDCATCRGRVELTAFEPYDDEHIFCGCTRDDPRPRDWVRLEDGTILTFPKDPRDGGVELVDNSEERALLEEMRS